jgi:hypothetical protein
MRSQLELTDTKAVRESSNYIEDKSERFARNLVMATQAIQPDACSSATLFTLVFRFLLKPQDMLAQRFESFFGDVAEQGIIAPGQRQGDLRPVLRLQRLEGRRKEMAIFHRNVTPLVLDKIANDPIDSLPKHLTIGENGVDRLRHLPQAFGSLSVLACEIADLRGRGRIAHREPGKDQVFLRMMVYFRVDFKIADDRPDHFVVGTFAAVEDIKFMFEDIEQLLEIAVLSGQELYDHWSNPQTQPIVFFYT